MYVQHVYSSSTQLMLFFLFVCFAALLRRTVLAQSRCYVFVFVFHLLESGAAMSHTTTQKRLVFLEEPVHIQILHFLPLVLLCVDLVSTATLWSEPCKDYWRRSRQGCERAGTHLFVFLLFFHMVDVSRSSVGGRDNSRQR